MAGLNHYDVLGIRQDATTEEIKKAYRKLAAKTHPDVAGPAMAPLFLAVQEAWEKLGTESNRASYDRNSGNSTRPEQEPQHQEPEPSQSQQYSQPDQDYGKSSDQFDYSPPEGAAKPAPPVVKITETRRLPRVFIVTVCSAILWGQLSALLLAYSVLTPAVSADSPDRSGAVVYLAAWTTGLLLSLNSRRKGKGHSKAPLIAAGVGLALVFASYREFMPLLAPIPVFGLATSWLLAALYARRRRLTWLGLAGKNRSTMVAFEGQELEHETSRARSMSSTLLAQVASLPGTRILVNATVTGRSVGHLIINGDRVAVVDSAVAGSWPGLRLTGDLRRDFDQIKHELRTTLHSDITVIGKAAPELRGWLIVHHMNSGSVELEAAGSVRITAASGSEAVNEIRAWLSGGDNVGRVSLDLIYRVLNGGKSPLY